MHIVHMKICIHIHAYIILIYLYSHICIHTYIYIYTCTHTATRPFVPSELWVPSGGPMSSCASFMHRSGFVSQPARHEPQSEPADLRDSQKSFCAHSRDQCMGRNGPKQILKSLGLAANGLSKRLFPHILGAPSRSTCRNLAYL